MMSTTCTSLLRLQARHYRSQKPFVGKLLRCLSTAPQPDLTMVDARFAPFDFDTECAVVYRDFISTEEADALLQVIQGRMKRRRYEKGHWDAVITNYKEVELPEAEIKDSEYGEILLPLFARVREHLAQHHLDRYDDKSTIEWLQCHAIDLKKDGELNAHVDSIKFSGDIVAGVSLKSSGIMRLVPDEDGVGVDGKPVEYPPDTPLYEGHVDMYLPPRSLYAMTGVGRYRYSHQLLPDQSVFTSPDGTETVVSRDHRLSVIFRDTKH